MTCASFGVCSGAAPFMLSERAYEKVKNRKTKVQSWYFDMVPCGQYWGWEGSRFYHHTGPVSTWWGFELPSLLFGQSSIFVRQVGVSELVCKQLSSLLFRKMLAASRVGSAFMPDRLPCGPMRSLQMILWCFCGSCVYTSW